MSYTIIHGIINLIGDKKLSHSLVQRLSIFTDIISGMFMVLRMLFAMWLLLSCTLNKFLTYFEKSLSNRILWNARRHFSLFTRFFLNKKTIFLSEPRGYYITLLLSYNDRHPTWQIYVRGIFVEHSHDIFPEYLEEVPYEIPGDIFK